MGIYRSPQRYSYSLGDNKGKKIIYLKMKIIGVCYLWSYFRRRPLREYTKLAKTLDCLNAVVLWIQGNSIHRIYSWKSTRCQNSIYYFTYYHLYVHNPADKKG